MPDAGYRHAFLLHGDSVICRTLDTGTLSRLMFRFRKVRSSKFSAAGMRQTDGPAPDALALLAGCRLCIRQAPFGAE